ncbi:hypothetical protein PR202_gb13760 [Eleusine coracana subsp. coracana]|uniref:DUF1618 domain-containing protein n=1 Tax=Eleusine coracana subsp. coracana TaxID=191504 RepID=A0AAV5ER21_ELECO|nr:hypothetical protein PR202_gb13760 [Eleusine coracana subsp. coracana]
MKEAIGIQTQPPDRALVKKSASPPPSAPGPVLVETPASSPPPRAPAPSLVKPPATPPQRAPARREASASPAPTTGGASWLLLDRFIHRSKKQRGIYGGDPTTSEVAYDCAGRIVRVSVRIADPPLVSRLYLHWTLKPPLEDVTDPAVVAAHRNSILFKVTVPFEDDSWWHNSCGFPIDYFVYSTSSSSNVPSLTRLPPCFDERRRRNDEEDKLFKPYRRQRQRCMIDQDMGLLCHGQDGEFTVADLTCRFDNEVELCLLHHSPRSSATPMQWKIKKLPTPPDMKIYPCSLTTDTVFPIGDGRSLCWVDYYHGLLLVDVLRANSDSDNPSADQTPLIRYIPLPKQALKSKRPCPDAFSPDPYRHVCITDAGIVKLVCIFTKYFQPTFTIITWSLLDIRKGNWIKDCGTIMGDAEFFTLLDAAHQSSHLPRVKPSFPVVSLADPDIIFFLLKEVDVDRNTYWVIEVNMREKVLQSTAMYIREEEEEGYIPGKPRWNFYGQYFVPSMFSSYVEQDVSKRYLSIFTFPVSSC